MSLTKYGMKPYRKLIPSAVLRQSVWTRELTSWFRVKQGERGDDMHEQRESTLVYLEDGSDDGVEYV